MSEKTKTDPKPMVSGVDLTEDAVHLPVEEELATIKAILVGVLKVFGGRVTVPMTYLDQYPYKGALQTAFTEQGMVVDYTEPEGGDG